VLDLHKDIVLTTSTGYQAFLTQAHADMAKGTVDSDEHVNVKLTNGTLTADRLRITGNGDVVRFEGNVVMNLTNLDGAQVSPVKAEAEPPAAPPPRPHRSKSTNAK
jgi:lipopolysaccharide export system protein LptC